MQGWLYTLATSQWEQTASPSTRVHESWWNTMKFGLLESLHEEANLVREYVQKPLLEGLGSILSGVSYIADELAPVFLNTPYTVSEGAALEELALETARVAHFFGETAKSSALIRRIGLFGRGVETETRLLSSVRRISSNVANKPFISAKATAEGWLPPYPKDLDIREISDAKDIGFSRVHLNPNEPAGGFLVREKVLARLNYDPSQIKTYLGLPDVPIYITDVNVPAGAKMLVGRIGAQPNFGLMTESGFQYQLEDIIPVNNFYNTRPLASLVEDEYPTMTPGR